MSYLTMGFVVMLLQALYASLSSGAGSVIMVLFILTVLPVYGITRNEDISIEAHAAITLFLEMCAVMAVGAELRSTEVYFMLLMQPLFMAVLYLNEAVLKYMLLLVLVQHFILQIQGFAVMSGRPELDECIIFYLVLGVYYMSMKYLIKMIQFRERQSYEQECSMDDMLKVVWSKCEEAQNATKSKSEFLSHMSHEIRTPINAILGMNEMILRESNEENIIGYASDVESAGTTLLSLINDILDFSKIETEKMDIIPVEYKVTALVNDLVTMVEPRLKKKDLNLKVEVNPNMPSVLVGDDVRIRQVLINILTNAVKYTEKGSVTLTLNYRRLHDGIQLLVKVRDTGIGIKQENLEKIFKSFQRVDEVKNRTIEGTGLGLSIASSLISLMDGEMEVESEYGQGTIFYVNIPQKVASNDPVGAFDTWRSARASERKQYNATLVAPDAKILVVDDNSMNLNVIVLLLKQTKVQIDTAPSGRECIEKAMHKRYDLILMDHMMPEMDGVETLARLKAEIPGFGTPVIALTANAAAGSKEIYLSYGFQDYLSKPVRGDLLEEQLKNWLPPDMLLSEEATPVDEASDDAATDENKDFPDEINVKSALEFSANGLDGVRTNIAVFKESAPEVLTKLLGAYEDKDWVNYAIHVHGLKSNLACIGAEGLSARAKELELKCKDGETDYVISHHSDFANDCTCFMEKLGVSYAEKESVDLISIANAIIDQAESFDAAGVEESVEKLKNIPDDQKTDEVKALIAVGEQLDFASIGEHAKKLLP
jgi:signal transduction histidine kinase/CheY-like chemotaxis protein